MDAADDLNVEITTTNIDQAKAEAVAWFVSHGLSQTGICDHPVSFMLNYNIADELQGSSIIFNPLPPDCQ